MSQKILILGSTIVIALFKIPVLRLGLSCPLLPLGLLRAFCHRLHRLVHTKKKLVGNVSFHSDRDAPCRIVRSPERRDAEIVEGLVLRYRPVWVGTRSFECACSAFLE